MTVRPVRKLAQAVTAWVEVEAITPDGDIEVYGRQFTTFNEQRVVHAFADDYSGSMGHFFEDLRIGTSVVDYPVFDPDVIVGVGDPPPPPPPPPPATTVPVAYLDDVRTSVGITPTGDNRLATSGDLTTYLGYPVLAATRLALLTEAVSPSYSTYASYGAGTLGEEWDARSLAAQPNGTALSSSVFLFNRGLNRSGPLYNPGSTGPTLAKDAFGSGRHALQFVAANSNYAEITPDPTRLVGQPFVVFVVAKLQNAGAANSYVYSTGSVAASGGPTGERNTFNYSTTNGLVIYGGGTVQTVKSATGDPTTSGHHVFTLIHDGQNSIIRVDGVQLSAAAVTTFGQESRRQMRFGQNIISGANSADLLLGHALVYNASAAALGSDLASIEAALMTDWGVTTETVAVPTGLTATSTVGGEIALSWTAASRAVSYRIYRSTDSTVTTSDTLIGPVTATTYNNSGLTPGTTYWYGVQTVGVYGISAMSTVASATVAAFSGTSFTDNFTGTAAATLTGRTGVAAGGGTFSINSAGTAAQKTTTSSSALSVVYGPLSTSNQRATVTVVGRGGATNIGPICRSNLAMDSFYGLRVVSTGPALDLIVSVSGTITVLAATVSTFAGGDVLEVRAVGSTITCYRNGTLLTSVTNTAVSTGLYAGMRAGGATTQATLDDLTVTDI